MNETVTAYVGGALTAMLFVPGVALMMRSDRRLRARGFAMLAGGYTIQLVVAVLVRSSTAAAVDTALIVFFLWGWWSNGGGDGMRRAWKKLNSRIASMGRAPQTA